MRAWRGEGVGAPAPVGRVGRLLGEETLEWALRRAQEFSPGRGGQGDPRRQPLHHIQDSCLSIPQREAHLSKATQ